MTRLPAIALVVLSVACSAREPASTTDATTTDASTTDATTADATTGSTSESESTSGTSAADSSSTTSDVPDACVAAGWDTSLATYESLAVEAGDTYWYSIRSYEYFNDFSWGCAYLTTIEFVAGVPTRRTFELVDVSEDHTEDECSGVPFVEEAAAVGSTDAPYNVPIRTMTELYAGCCDLLALEPADLYVFGFDVDDQGVVADCHATENSCGEGCQASVDGFDGVHFETFAFGTPP